MAMMVAALIVVLVPMAVAVFWWNYTANDRRYNQALRAKKRQRKRYKQRLSNPK